MVLFLLFNFGVHMRSGIFGRVAALYSAGGVTLVSAYHTAHHGVTAVSCPLDRAQVIQFVICYFILEQS